MNELNLVEVKMNELNICQTLFDYRLYRNCLNKNLKEYYAFKVKKNSCNIKQLQILLLYYFRPLQMIETKNIYIFI